MKLDKKQYLGADVAGNSYIKLVVLYRPHSEHARSVEEFVENYEHNFQESYVNLMDVDSVEGIQLSELYDILRQPAVLVLAGDGSVLKSWVGDTLPLIDDVVGFMRS